MNNEKCLHFHSPWTRHLCLIRAEIYVWCLSLERGNPFLVDGTCSQERSISEGISHNQIPMNESHIHIQIHLLTNFILWSFFNAFLIGTLLLAQKVLERCL